MGSSGNYIFETLKQTLGLVVDLIKKHRGVKGLQGFHPGRSQAVGVVRLGALFRKVGLTASAAVQLLTQVPCHQVSQGVVSAEENPSTQQLFLWTVGCND